MKRLLLFPIFIFAMKMSAQTDVDSHFERVDASSMKHQVFTNGFWNNWFLTATISGKSFYSDEENDISPSLSGSPFKDFRTNLGLSFSVGKWFTPGIGIRTKVSGFWGKNVLSDNSSINAIKYWNVQEQVLFNMSNLLSGYNEKRRWSVSPYLGVGLLRNCSDDEYAHGASFGIINSWKVSKRMDIIADVGFYISDDDIDGAARTNTDEYAISFSTADRAFYAEVGLAYHLGKRTWKKASDSYSIIEKYMKDNRELNNELHDVCLENEKLKEQMLATADSIHQKEAIVEKYIIPSVSLFFSSGNHKVSKKELQNVEELVRVAKSRRGKILVKGYADSATGTSEYNALLSQKRAEAVAREIEKMGVEPERIEIFAAGGINTWSPSTFNRRVVVSVESME